MKKFLPLILFVIGLAVFVTAYFVFIRGKKGQSVEEEGSGIVTVEVAFGDRPVTSLTPNSDGHWLKLKIDKIKIKADSLDYELLYELPDGRTQGVPGTIKLGSQTSIERDLLLGSESSGKFRYDEGVQEGTLTLRFRNSEGKLVAKFATKFHLQSKTTKLTSLDGNFTYTLSKTPSKAFFVTMRTFGIGGSAPAEVKEGPYGVFSSTKDSVGGKVTINSSTAYRWDGSSWTKLSSGTASGVGIFIGTN